MMNFIRFEYLLAAGMVVENVERITMSELNEFRVKVQQEFDKRHIDAMFLFSSKYAEEAMFDYPKLFQFEDSACTAIIRKPGVDNQKLIEKFFAYLSTDDLMAIIAVAKEHYTTEGFER